MDSDLQEISKIQRNWDGYDGCTFMPETIAHAQRVLTALKSAGFEVDVTPNPNGTVSLEWEFGAIEVGKSRGIGYVKQPTQ